MYLSSVYHACLTRDHGDIFNHSQKRVLRIVCPDLCHEQSTSFMPYFSNHLTHSFRYGILRIPINQCAKFQFQKKEEVVVVPLRTCIS